MEIQQPKTKNGEKTARNKAEQIKEAGKATRFSSTNQPVKNGRKKLMKNIIKGIPDDAKEEIATAMFKAVSCKNAREAEATINKIEKKGTKYGLIYEEVIKAIRKDGLDAIISVLEWIYGKNINNRISGELQTTSTVNFRPYKGLSIEEIRAALKE